MEPNTTHCACWAEASTHQWVAAKVGAKVPDMAHMPSSFVGPIWLLNAFVALFQCNAQLADVDTDMFRACRTRCNDVPLADANGRGLALVDMALSPGALRHSVALLVAASFSSPRFGTRRMATSRRRRPRTKQRSRRVLGLGRCRRAASEDSMCRTSAKTSR